MVVVAAATASGGGGGGRDWGRALAVVVEGSMRMARSHFVC